MNLTPIGTIRTPFREARGTPVQSAFAEDARGEVILGADFADALEDIEGFERIWVIYWLDRAGEFQPRVVPYLDTREHGLFATRSPCRPNPLGISAVRLLGRDGRVLRVAGVDMLDGSPLLDIKPYIPEFDAHPGVKAGWYDGRSIQTAVADARFHERER